ncbi:hypothetical protein CXQ80_17290 [Pseudomonas sp. 02C 26]|uniref:DUF6270 domain-containing protein n=1 Tax=Pseudomonas sp. 02C 26 TaxID=2054914 RepID=UPI000C6E6A42|nr:DUF6270 domain-containing protein [Pseudomonas sp. 02C 26]AUF97454.1 hypothetical protein CXQ80_17290 [Pseudomonas sp. 02C 26]
MQVINVLIFGSCVSRDAVEYDKDGIITLVDYFARSSLAGVGTAASDREVSLSEITSAFQRRIVTYELEKTFLARVQREAFDVLLIDLIDERFALSRSPETGAIFSLSNELLKTDFTTAYPQHETVPAVSDEHFALWERGWQVLVGILLKTQQLDKVLVNRVLWAKRDVEGRSLEDMYREGWIEKNNDFLRKMYKRMAQDLQPDQFVTFSADELHADPAHKWGVSPFHYTPGTYEKVLEAMTTFNCSNRENLQPMMLAKQLSMLEFGQDVDVVTLHSAATIDTLPGLNDFYTQVTTRDAEDIVNSSLAGKPVLVASPRHAGTMRMLGSTYLASRNFIYFDDNGTLAVMVQHHKFCRALYYPALRLLLKLDTIDLPNSCLNVLHEYCASRKDEFEQYFLSAVLVQNRSAGLLVSYARPYHYFYDMLPSAMTYRDSVRAEHDILSIRGGSFFPAFSMFGKDQGREFESDAALSDYLLAQRKSIVSSGYPQSRPSDFIQYDALIVTESLRRLQRDEPILIERLEGADGVFWFGLCLEKRIWKEQIQAIREIIADLLQAHSAPLFIFDGLTATEDAGPNFRATACGAEMKLLNDVVIGLVPQNTIVNLIGVSAQKKIACAHYVSLFLTSFLTDSMYVARFNRRPGIGYGARTAMHTDHVHPDTYFVPLSWVVDDPAGSRNWSEVSYSIDPNLMRSYYDAVRKKNTSRLDVKGIQLKASSDVTLTVIDDGIELTADTGQRHMLLALVPDRAKVMRLPGDLEIPANTSIVIRFLGKSDRKLSISTVVTIKDDRRGAESEYITLGKSLHLPAVPSARRVSFAVRLKGEGRAAIRALDCISLEAPMPSNDLDTSGYRAFDVAATPDSIANLPQVTANYRCDLSGTPLYFRYVPNGSQNLLVFFHSALTRTADNKMPAFAGNGAIGLVDANILMISDPAITDDNNISLAWYAGMEGVPFQTAIQNLIEGFSHAVGSRRTVLYGGSGGGFASLYYGRNLPNSYSIGANPQINISSYNEGSVTAYLNTCFPSSGEGSNDSRLKQTGIDYTLSRNFQQNTVIYLQNVHDHHHINVHLPQYFSGKSPDIALGGNWVDENTLMYISNAWGLGHAAPPRAFVFEALKYLFSASFCREELEQTLRRLDDKNASLINRVSLRRDGEQLVCAITANLPSGSEGDARYAFYLLQDGKRIAYIPYQADAKITFKAENDVARYQAVGFVRFADRTSSVKSNKIIGSTE